ncbi:hypothetical protein K6Y31_20615 [Motilimonas cestriensis]|uniref:Uncharacterized protein n=1 Tax=Motilimonas cestriensis TaxID=2742685 RepID=A0ABS8WFY9_9GAMM|nr:hypothetical protein [Motilimonas cestriensis]MCE2597180.1 hypothetical protein [Motilimonas cestriensis]
MKQSDLEYLGKMDGRDAWQFGDEYFYWSPGANVVTYDLAGQLKCCDVVRSGERGQRVIKPLTKADVKRCIAAKLNK